MKSRAGDLNIRPAKTPKSVVASAGTVSTGAIDPIAGIADIAKREEMWLHVDGAYGAFFRLVDELRPVLAGIERADSLTLDPHKGLFLPYGVGALLVRDGETYRNSPAATRYLVRESRGYMGDYYLRQIADTLYQQLPQARAVVRGEARDTTYFRFLDDPVRTDQPEALDHVEADAAEPEHHAIRARLDPGGVDDRTHAGGDAAADVAGLVEGRVGTDLRHRDLGHDGVVGEG